MRSVFYTTYLDDDGDVVWTCLYADQLGLVGEGATPNDAYLNLCQISTAMRGFWPSPHLQ